MQNIPTTQEIPSLFVHPFPFCLGHVEPEDIFLCFPKAQAVFSLLKLSSFLCLSSSEGIPDLLHIPLHHEDCEHLFNILQTKACSRMAL